MTAPSKQSVEEAREALHELAREVACDKVGQCFTEGTDVMLIARAVKAAKYSYLAGHASRDAEVEAMRAKRIEELEGLAKEVCPGCAANSVAACYYSNVISACPSAPIHAAIALAKGE
jgi:hypothetical protein